MFKLLVPPRSQRPAPSRGFTLIELMITVVIIGVLAAVAVPSYNQYIVTAKLTDATSGLADARLKLEQWYQDNRRYGVTGTVCGAATGAPAGSPTVTMPATGIFAYTCATSSSGQGFTVTATSQAGKGLGSAAGHYIYTLDHTNTRATTKYANATQSAKACWLVRGSEC